MHIFSFLLLGALDFLSCSSYTLLHLLGVSRLPSFTVYMSTSVKVYS